VAEIVNLNAIFGGKPWFKSVTAWGLVALVGVTSGLDEACAAGMLSEAHCVTATAWATNIGLVLTALGFRRAAGGG